MPVLLSNGEVITAPWYITVDGEKVALVESQEAARDVVMGVVEKYRSRGGMSSMLKWKNRRHRSKWISRTATCLLTS